MIITSCGNSVKLAKSLAKKLRVKYVPLDIGAFPDGDMYMRFKAKSFKKKKVVIVQSFQPNPDMSLFDVIWAAETAKDIGARKVILVAPYLAFMRQDKRFNSGEAVSSRIMAKLLNKSIDKIITIDPHLHRYKSLKEIFTISAKKLTANPLIGEFVKKKIKNPVILGPDWESYQWADKIASHVGCDSTCLAKTRFSSRRVTSKMTKNVEIKGKNVVIIDDIISTGHTIIEAAKKAKKKGAKSITAIGVHGLFAENAISKMKKYVDWIYTTNTIEHKTSKIDVLPLVLKELKILK
ncbi:ribose-phosphate diphosphokinase [Candidatus Woesearchaeota archaeon]|jgi:ribose-phosphate pyrophosphokinase|nr:ribose-phosphate diphosphokinase [Candidatus Woesearchaeota archaeon]MBT4150455.1 ribose-phosphate diphosphokinase [Candidatus Woesearchaeota archaeon]MBT4246997.1 ribose-phosphate diphosphokinase [Candidatus Woesearchaeota archaeon]MBT4434491.1 ribose-phosphate diphosphokinase [Candidatus Woesearchaeota archaeon]